MGPHVVRVALTVYIPRIASLLNVDVTGKSRLLFSSTSSRSNRTPRALFREKLPVLESK